MTAPKPRVVGLNARGLGLLKDGTPYFAPLGEIPYDRDEDKVQCHLCGDWFRLVGSSHLRWHGWTLDQYRESFQLLRKSSTAAAGVSRKLCRKAIARRQVNEQFANPPPASGPQAVRTVAYWRSLGALRPDLAAQLHPTRNRGLDPFAVGLWSAQRVWALRELRLRVARRDRPPHLEWGRLPALHVSGLARPARALARRRAPRPGRGAAPGAQRRARPLPARRRLEGTAVVALPGLWP